MIDVTAPALALNAVEGLVLDVEAALAGRTEADFDRLEGLLEELWEAAVTLRTTVTAMKQEKEIKVSIYRRIARHPARPYAVIALVILSVGVSWLLPYPQRIIVGFLALLVAAWSLVVELRWGRP